MRYSILAPAKINLYLDVLSKREDGYHEIKSVMQAISIYDEITLDITNSDKIIIRLNGSEPSLKWDESNLVYKACTLFLNEAKLDGYSFDFYVKKNIPICAGMAGGSTDAAGALLLLNQAFGNRFSIEDLCSLGAKLGADVAFCIRGGTCICEGVGEVLTPLPPLDTMYLVCAIDSSSISTPRAYSLLDEKYGIIVDESSNFKVFLKSAKNKDIHSICSLLFNKFESVIIPLNENIRTIKELLLKNGAIGALMSGSGPSVFGIFETEDAQKNAFFALQREKIRVFLCKSL